jgi:hypothetical protein
MESSEHSPSHDLATLPEVAQLRLSQDHPCISGERLGSIVSVGSFSSDALCLNQGRCQWEAINLELCWLNHQFYGVFYCSGLNLARYEEGYSASVSVLALRDANHPYARRKLRCD